MFQYAPLVFQLFASNINAALTVHQGASRCTSLAAAKAKASDSGVLNSTYIGASGLSVGGMANTIPFCRIFATELYAVDKTVIYEVWLPDPADYNERYLSVGM